MPSETEPLDSLSWRHYGVTRVLRHQCLLKPRVNMPDSRPGLS